MADKRLRTMVFPGLEDTYTIPQDMNDLESIDAVAEPYDEFTAYAIGDYCSNGGKLYRCNTAIPSGETWNANHWTETNVGDEILAEKAATSTALNGKVSKSGDTMSGELIVQNSAISAKSTTADTSDDAPASTTYWDIKHTDKNNRVAAYWETSYSTNGLSRTVFRARRNVNGSNINNGFALEVNKKGERFVSFDDSAAWRSALGLGEIVNGTNTSGNVSIPSGTPTEFSSLTLTTGVWIVIACADWAANGSGYRQIATGMATNPTRQNATTTVGLNGKEAYQQLTLIRTIAESSSNIVFYGLQNSGSTLAIYPYVYAVRVG